jgi:hypothetical protein
MKCRSQCLHKRNGALRIGGEWSWILGVGNGHDVCERGCNVQKNKAVMLWDELKRTAKSKKYEQYNKTCAFSTAIHDVQ